MVLLRSVMMLAMCGGWYPCPEHFDVADGKELPSVKIALTTFYVTDTTLEVAWTIRNDGDHDVWVCDDITPGGPSGFDMFPSHGGKVLVLRRRFDLPVGIIGKVSPWARYIRLGSGQEKIERFAFNLPIRRYATMDAPYERSTHPEHLVLEIGYYDEDLPGVIRHIAEVAEKVSPDIDVRTLTLSDFDTVDRFFPGWPVAVAFHYGQKFRDSVIRAGDEGEVTIPYMRQVLRGERVLRATIANVAIRYAD